MQIVTQYPNGIFNWVDLSTTDIEGAKAFYRGIFGWEATDIPISSDMGGSYTNFSINGHGVAGGGQISPEMQANGMPTTWMSYVKHDDADAMAARITAAGGTLVMPPMDVMEEGRMLMAIDPTGATFGVWQPRRHIGAELVNIANTLVWNELATRDAAAAKTFYNAVFGWAGEADAQGYTTFILNGRRHAGLMQMDSTWDPSIPANWTVYFAVDDLAQTVAKAQELGGKIIMPATPAGEIGSFAIIQDPQGAVFSVIQMNGPGDPPPSA
ncbi:MAG: VOC family protein [Chloroflexi bacterium]|nr:VOC family protein [Chloroflexota bacterium]MBP8059230.1 VOC family protein [Chloroflexota bacterium]